MVTYTPLEMTGVFADTAVAFLEHKRSLGYKYLSEEKVLRRFCRFADSYCLPEPALTSSLYARG